MQYWSAAAAPRSLARSCAAIVIAAGLGLAAANLVRWAFLHDQIQEVLKTPLLIALTLGIYSVSNLVMSDSGLIAATIFGAALTNMHVPGLAELRRFKESLVILLVSGLFIVLTADLNRGMLAHLSWPIFRLTLLMLFVVRPAAIFIATWRSRLTVQERILSAWIAPRGIVAAAVAGVVGLRLESAGYPSGRLVMPSVFAVIAATMVFHGFTLRPLARRLKLTLSDEPGVAIIGASDWSTDMAAVLAQAGVPVLLVDIYPGALDPGPRTQSSRTSGGDSLRTGQRGTGRARGRLHRRDYARRYLQRPRLRPPRARIRHAARFSAGA